MLDKYLLQLHMYKDFSIIEKRLKVLADSNNLISVLTADGIRKYVNKTFCDYFEKREDELIGSSLFYGYSENQREIIENKLLKLNTQNEPVTVILNIGNNNAKIIEWTITGICDDNKNLIELVAIGKDISELNIIKTQKEEINALLNAYVEAIDSNIICSITDKKGVITYANKKFCEVSKYNLNELVGNTHNVINSGFHSKDFFTNMWKSISNGKVWEGEIKNKAKDGNYYWVETVIIPIKDSNSKINKFLSLRILKTQIKEMEEEILRLLKSHEDMLFMISHEVRRPITSIMGVLNIFNEKEFEDTESKLMLNYLMESIQELDYYSRKMTKYIYEHKNENKFFSNIIA